MRKHLGIGLKVAVSVGLLGYLFTVLPLGEIGAALGGVRPVYLLFGLLLVPPTVLLGAYQQKVLTDRQGMSLSMIQIAEINAITRFYGLFLPGYLAGGAVRWYRMAVVDGQPIGALASILYNRLIDTYVVLLLGAVFFMLARPDGFGLAVPTLFLLMAGGLAVGHALALRISSGSEPQSEQVPGTGVPRIWRWLRRKAFQTGNALRRFRALRLISLAGLGGMAASRHLLGVFAFTLFALSLGIGIGVAEAGWIRSILLVALMLPISFAGLGVREASLVVLLASYGVASADAVALGLLFLGRDILHALVGGLLEARLHLGRKVLVSDGTGLPADPAPGRDGCRA